MNIVLYLYSFIPTRNAAKIDLTAPDARDVGTNQFEAVDAVGALFLRTERLRDGLLVEQGCPRGNVLRSHNESTTAGLDKTVEVQLHLFY